MYLPSKPGTGLGRRPVSPACYADGRFSGGTAFILVRQGNLAATSDLWPAHSESASTMKRRSPMGDIAIEVTQLDDGTLITSPRVSRGGTVTWIFKGGLAQRQLQVRRKDDHSIPSFTRPKPDRIEVQPFPPSGTGSSFRYEIVDSTGKVLPWADGSNGECIEPQDPP